MRRKTISIHLSDVPHKGTTKTFHSFLFFCFERSKNRGSTEALEYRGWSIDSSQMRTVIDHHNPTICKREGNWFLRNVIYNKHPGHLREIWKMRRFFTNDDTRLFGCKYTCDRTRTIEVPVRQVIFYRSSFHDWNEEAAMNKSTDFNKYLSRHNFIKCNCQ